MDPRIPGEQPRERVVIGGVSRPAHLRSFLPWAAGPPVPSAGA